MQIAVRTHKTHAENVRRMREGPPPTATLKSTGREYSPNGHTAVKSELDKIEVNIDRLVLRDFDTANRYQVAIALENEFARLLSEGGAPPLLTTSRKISRLRSTTLDLKPGSNGRSIGICVAREAYRRLNL